MGKFLINIDDGHLAFRDKFVDRQVNMKPIPDEVAYMISNGEVSSDDVVKAVNAKIRESGEYDDIEKYLKERAKLNVRKSNPQKAIAREALRDRSVEEVSLGDVMAAKDSPEKKGKPKTARAKVEEALEDKPKSAFPFPS